MTARVPTEVRGVVRLVHFVYTRWDRWTACGLSKSQFKAELGSYNRRTTGVVQRITCPRCLRIVGVES